MNALPRINRLFSLLTKIGLTLPLKASPATEATHLDFVPQHHADSSRRAKRLRVRVIGRRQERRERCAGYRLKAAVQG